MLEQYRAWAAMCSLAETMSSCISSSLHFSMYSWVIDDGRKETHPGVVHGADRFIFFLNIAAMWLWILLFITVGIIAMVVRLRRMREIVGGVAVMLAGARESLHYIKDFPDDGRPIWERPELQPNDVLKEMYSTETVRDADGKEYSFHSGVSQRRGYVLYDLIKRNANIRDVLEVGMAFGTSALYICQAFADRADAAANSHLISIDPGQTADWHKIGRLNVERAGLADYHELIEEPSQLAMPRMITEGRQFDLIFVDGMHTFDHTLMDIFFAVRLLREGGILFIDDVCHYGVPGALNFVDANYGDFLKPVKDQGARRSSMMYVKIGDDNRPLDYHRAFSSTHREGCKPPKRGKTVHHRAEERIVP